MKSVVLMVLAGVGLFTGTVTGLLAVQGRLNYEGTRGLPLVNSLFSKTAEEGGEHGAEPEHPAEEMSDPAAEGIPPRLDGLGRESRLPREIGPSIEAGASVGVEGRSLSGDAEGEDGSAMGGHETADGGHGESSTEEPLETDREFAHRAESLMGQDQYRRGKLFQFPRLVSGMSVEEINGILTSAKEFQKSLERQKAALEQLEAELAARETDLEDREKAVLEKMREVLQQRSVLEEEIAVFQETYTLVRANEVSQYQSYAETLSTLPTEKSSQIILRYWETPEGADKAVKILKMMSADARDELFAALTAEQTQDILDRLTMAVVEPPKD